MSDVQYYQTDGGVIFAYVDGKRELFRLRKTPVIVWEHIASESFEWDQVHQAIFRNHRFDLVQDEDLLQDIPPLPEVVHVQVKPQETFAANDFPYIAAKVKNTRGGRLPLIILLDEDWYESRMGDWESHSLRGVYLDNDEVQLGIDQIKQENLWHHIRSMSVAIDGQYFELSGPELQVHDHCTVEAILRVMEDKLRAEGKDDA